MPIKIYIPEVFEEIDFLCEEIWDLTSQIYELEKWLDNNADNLIKGKYVSDIGFTSREKHSGGGSVISLKMINTLSKIGMEVFLTEYPK